MLLVAPPEPRRPASAGAVAADRGHSPERGGVGDRDRGADRGRGRAGGRGEDHLGGAELLARLRGDARARPRFDPGLGGGLRAWLEDAAYEVTAASPDGEPVLLGSRQLFGTGLGPRTDRTGGTAVERLLRQLVHAAFRQIVQTGGGEVSLRDALDALVARGDRLVAEEVASLEASERAAVDETLQRHVRHLSFLLPRFAPTWFPRTDEYLAIPLAGGRVVLHGVFDLLVGLPRPGSASLCALGLAIGDRARQRRSLHFLALLETLRSGAPPFRLALLESATGLYGVEDVREEHLCTMAAHVVGALAGIREPRCAGERRSG